jgi:hypothetical protein
MNTKSLQTAYNKLNKKYTILPICINNDDISILYNKYLIIHIKIPSNYPLYKPSFGIEVINLALNYKSYLSNILYSKYSIDNNIIDIIYSHINCSHYIYSNIKEYLLLHNNHQISLDYDDIINNIKLIAPINIIFKRIIKLCNKYHIL